MPIVKKDRKMKKIVLVFMLILILPLVTKAEESSETKERICFKTTDIDNIIFKKDHLIFENRKNINYSLTCKGSRYLNFQNPLIIEPIKMGNKICSNDVLKLKNYSCFVDKITLLEEDKKI
tara:strand:- start:4076 stop:4438 length:363 start_codon:yes stop_codon:yes gene_type:complete